MKFEFAIDHCDVRLEERPRLERFRERLSTWHGWLTGDEHSIWNQIHQMLWNDIVFRTINECRRLAAKSPSPAVGFNTAVAAFIDQSYAANQLLAIRRLTENRAPHRSAGQKYQQPGAITLTRLLDDMKCNADLFTREMYVCHDGLPFDPTPARERSFSKLVAEAEKRSGVVFGGLPTTGPEAYNSAILAHRSFDRLKNLSGGTASRDDKLDETIFGKLKSKLGMCTSVNKVASKFIAHAADAGSRGQLNDRERAITLNRIEACQRTICRVADT